MSEGNVYFTPAGAICRRNLLCCDEATSVQQAAQQMRDARCSSIFIRRDGRPLGVMTDRDLRSRVVAEACDPRELRVGEIMNFPIISVAEGDHLLEVLFKMTHHRIHRVGVVDAEGQLCGIISESDIMNLQSQSPQQLLFELEGVEDIAGLKQVHRKIEQMVITLSRAGVHAPDLMRLIALLHDQTSLRLIELLRRDCPELCCPFSFLVLGSEGRSEQTLKTDQDNAILFSDDCTSAQQRSVAAFSQRLIDGLIEVGVPECPGGIMAKNPFWRRSLSDWRLQLDRWMAVPTGENILNFSMFSDVRCLWGEQALVDELQQFMLARAQEEPLFIARLAENCCQFRPPLGFFGGIKTERFGEPQGLLDLKKAGIFSLGEGIKILALEQGCLTGGTFSKLDFLQQQGVLDAQLAEDVRAAFSLLCFLRIRTQVNDYSAGREASNLLCPADLNRVETSRLETAFEVVKSLQNFLKKHYQLDAMPS